MVIQEAARYGCFPKLTFSPYLSEKVSAFFGKPTWSPKTNTTLAGNSVSAISFPSSSKTYMLAVSAFAFTSTSKPLLLVLMPGCALPLMTFLSMLCQVFTSVRASYKREPSICRCSGGCGGPFKTVWKVTFLRMPCDKKRLATMHSYAMSRRPASCRFVHFVSVRPLREYRMNSRIDVSSLGIIQKNYKII